MFEQASYRIPWAGFMGRIRGTRRNLWDFVQRVCIGFCDLHGFRASLQQKLFAALPAARARPIRAAASCDPYLHSTIAPWPAIAMRVMDFALGQAVQQCDA